MFAPRRVFTVPLPSGRVLHLGERPLLMGILNVTPDSFADPTAYLDAAAAIDRALVLEAEGADLIDIGAESTRPGARGVSAAEELDRLLPVLRAVARRLRIPCSVDTYKGEVARRALAEGADIVNDVSGLQYDSSLGPTVASAGAALIVMHTRGRPETMYAEAVYQNVVREVAAELRAGVDRARSVGVDEERIIVDPGIGFAKRGTDSYGVLARLCEVAAALGRPVLVGPSRKSFMSAALDGRPPAERDWGTAAAVTAAVLTGAHIVRVHAVAEMRQVMRVAEEIRRHHM